MRDLVQVYRSGLAWSVTLAGSGVCVFGPASRADAERTANALRVAVDQALLRQTPEELVAYRAQLEVERGRRDGVVVRGTTVGDHDDAEGVAE